MTPDGGKAGTYDLRVFVVPPPDVFSVTLPMDTATDTLGSGQANLETNVSEDDYTFTLSATHTLELEPANCPGGSFFGAIHEEIVDSSSSVVSSNTGCHAWTSSSLSAGTYTLRVTPDGGKAGTYDLKLYEVPPPDVFSVTLPMNTSTDTLGSGQAKRGQGSRVSS